MLLAGAGLLIRSFARLQSVEPGFHTSGLLTFQLSLPDPRYPVPDDAARFYQGLLDRARTVPGVAAAEAITGLPLDGYSYIISTSSIDGVRLESAAQPSTQIRVVTPGLFSTMGIRLLRGRPFSERDRLGASDVAVMSESAARLLFGESDPLGRSLTIGTGFGLGRGNVGGEVVGIVADIHDVSLGTPPRPTIYFPHAQRPLGNMAVVIRAGEGTDPALLVNAVRDELRAMDQLLPMVAVKTMDRLAQSSVAQPRFAMLLLAAFAAVALALAAIGVFGVMSYLVGLRTPEIGLRMALGAGGRTVVAETVRRALKPVAIGVTVGTLGALALSRTMTNLLYEVTPGDPATYLAVSIGLALIAILAAWIPARRASRVDPVMALRAE
jgi:predicted permease